MREKARLRAATAELGRGAPAKHRCRAALLPLVERQPESRRCRSRRRVRDRALLAVPLQKRPESVRRGRSSARYRASALLICPDVCERRSLERFFRLVDRLGPGEIGDDGLATLDRVDVVVELGLGNAEIPQPIVERLVAKELNGVACRGQTRDVVPAVPGDIARIHEPVGKGLNLIVRRDYLEPVERKPGCRQTGVHGAELAVLRDSGHHMFHAGSFYEVFIGVPPIGPEDRIGVGVNAPSPTKPRIAAPSPSSQTVAVTAQPTTGTISAALTTTSPSTSAPNGDGVVRGINSSKSRRPTKSATAACPIHSPASSAANSSTTSGIPIIERTSRIATGMTATNAMTPVTAHTPG